MVIDDSLYEGEESFNVSLAMPVGGRLGMHYHTTKVNILEDADDGKPWERRVANCRPKQRALASKIQVQPRISLHRADKGEFTLAYSLDSVLHFKSLYCVG